MRGICAYIDVSSSKQPPASTKATTKESLVAQRPSTIVKWQFSFFSFFFFCEAGDILKESTLLFSLTLFCDESKLMSYNFERNIQLLRGGKKEYISQDDRFNQFR